MSNAAEVEVDKNNVCANCGVAEVDDIKLMDCDGCDLVKCCSDKCKQDHREKHEEGCKKRRKELHDNKLFTQPERSHLEECPLCFLPMQLDPTKRSFYSCCSSYICDGCDYSNDMSNGGDRCPFCREPAPKDDKEHEKRIVKRVKANDPAAMCYLGTKRYHEGDHDKAFEYWTKAAELEDMDAHYLLSVVYYKGEGVAKDEEKEVYHWEKAAMGGHPIARHNLAVTEERNDNIDRAVKHFIIAANLGYEKSMKELWRHYSDGNIAKGELETTLRTHKAAIDAMKSPQREAVEAWRERQRGA